MLQILATGFMIFSLQELMEAYSDHPGILSLSIEKAQGNFGRGLTSMKINLEYNQNSTYQSSCNLISICIPT